MDGDKDAATVIAPQVGSVLHWMRLNLAVLMFVTTTVTAISSALIASALRVGEVAHDMTDFNRQIAEQRQALERFHLDMVDVDKRLNAGTASVSDGLHLCDNRAAMLEQRIAVLEAQLKFLADRLPPPSLGRR